MRIFKEKNNLDERQEQELLHIEKNSFWILYFLLAAALVIESCIGYTLRETAGEMICFAIASIYLMASCLRKGVWDRRLKADGKTNLTVSLVGGVIAAVITTATVTLRFPVQDHLPVQAALTFLITFFLTFSLCLVLLTCCTVMYRHRVRKLEEKVEQEDS